MIYGGIENEKAIFINYGYVLSIERRFELIKNAGVDSVMVWLGNGDEDKLVSLTNEYNLDICNAHLPFDEINLIWSLDEDGDKYVMCFNQEV